MQCDRRLAGVKCGKFEQAETAIAEGFFCMWMEIVFRVSQEIETHRQHQVNSNLKHQNLLESF